MAQPPDQQPPQGGFGAPQDQPPKPPQPPQTPPPPQAPPVAGPPQPGYGYPQQPGPYGYPQQPGPYAAQPGYGHGHGYGYGYPQAPYPGAPGAPGVPGAPGAPTPPPGPGPRGPFKGKPAMVIGAALAVLLVVGGTVFAVTRGDGESGKDNAPVAEKSDDAKPSASDLPVNPGDGSGDGGTDPEDLNEGRRPGESRVLWYKEAPDAPGDGADALGMWITDETAVKAAYKQLFAFDVGDGAPTWDPITFPQEICAVTPGRSDDDKIVVAYMSGTSDRAECNQLQQIDLATGAKGWKGEVPDGALFDSTLTLELSLVDDTLMVGRSQSGTAYDVNTGKKLFDTKKYDETCFPAAFAGGAGRLVQVASCGAGTDDEYDELRELDPRTGEVSWTQRFDAGWRVARTYSLDPLVVYSTHEEKQQWNISMLGDDGAFTSQVAFDENFAPECGWAVLQRDLTGCQGVAVDSDTLYLPTEATTGANEIVAIGLADGKEKWRVKSPADEAMLPLQVEDGKLIAYVQASYGTGGRVVSIPTTGGDAEPTTLLQNPQGASEVEGGFFSRDLAWADGRLYLSTTRLTGNDDAKEKLMLAYGE
ncbi:PQQ-binding-like beta-propeller repeat protein [Streptomyces sp. NPDC056716]|uniref:outer membrane protein assembly factor BamB family protein n=1 Tax=unclassified Streptomyces TaxID=2593676 RepID=UPI0036BF50A3